MTVITTTIPRYEGGAIGLPEHGKYVVMTNSERREASCDLRWWFRYVERLKPKETRLALRAGDLWAKVTEDMYRWWAATDQPYPWQWLDVCGWCGGIGTPINGDPCRVCEATGRGPLMRERSKWLLEVALSGPDAGIGPDDVEWHIERVRRSAYSYLHVYQAGPLQQIKVTHTETALAAPIRSPRGRVYAPATLLAQTPGGYTVAGTGDVAASLRPGSGVTVSIVRWPWYYAGIIDSGGVDRRTGGGWILERKYTASPPTYIQNMLLDPQVAGYVWLARQHDEALGWDGVVGYFYDVMSSSYQHDPKPLKGRKSKANPNPPSPGLSRNRNITTPSWRYRAALAASGHNPADYEDHIQFLTEVVDRKLFARDWGTIGDEDQHRFAVELYADAARFSALRRAAARASTPMDVHEHFPRTPVCVLPGGSCAFRGVCLRDNAETRRSYTVGDAVQWTDTARAIDEQPDHETRGGEGEDLSW